LNGPTKNSRLLYHNPATPMTILINIRDVGRLLWEPHPAKISLSSETPSDPETTLTLEYLENSYLSLGHLNRVREHVNMNFTRDTIHWNCSPGILFIDYYSPGVLYYCSPGHQHSPRASILIQVSLFTKHYYSPKHHCSPEESFSSTWGTLLT
jgi:hypothetical protein